MQKEWLLKEKASKDFLDKHVELDAVTLQLLFNRGILDYDSVRDFLNLGYDKLHDPFLFRDMEASVDLIIEHIKVGKKIGICGDYDADGVTSTALLFETLSTLKAVDTVIYIPERAKEGYGLNNKMIDYLKERDVELIITVDCGIRNKEEVDYAKGLGMEAIITDHHILPEKKEDYPDCLIIDTADKDDKYPFKYLAGVGIAFKLASALINKSKLGTDIKERLKRKVLDLVAVGTVADMVKLHGENRTLTKLGLEEVNSTRRIGLKELLKVSGLEDKKANAWNIGFQIGPRINAAGRMGKANTAYDLLLTKDNEIAKDLANRLNDRNKERQEETARITDEAEKQVEAQIDDRLIVAVCPEASEKWNEGIIGLVAGRICEKYYKPVFVVTRTEDGFRSSGRSIPEGNLIEILEGAKDLLTKYGGHPAACGFNCSKENFEEFVKRVKELAKKQLEGVKLVPKIKIEHELNIEEVNEELIEKIKKFEPFGMNNPQPIFQSKDVVVKDVMTMGSDGQHIKFRLNGFWAVAFWKAKEYEGVKAGDKIDIAYTVEINEFNGRREVQLKVVDLKSRNA